jgi:hypothetical protein
MSFLGKGMELGIIRVSEISQTQKEKYHGFFPYVEYRPN